MSPATTLRVIVLLARMSSIRMPRTSTPSKRPLAVAISGVSISGTAEVTPGVFFACVGNLLPVGQAAVIALDDGVAVQADDLVEQLRAKAVHHAHDDDQRGNAERNCDQADAGDEEDESLALAGKQIAASEHPLGAVEDHAVSLARCAFEADLLALASCGGS